MALCHLVAGEIALLVFLHSIGVPDVITFTIFGMIVITLAYWLDKILKNKGIIIFGKTLLKRQNNKYQKFMLVGLCFVLTLITYCLMGMV